MEEQILSCKLDKKLYREMIELCKREGLKIRYFISSAIVEELNRRGRYEFKSVKR